MQWGEGTDMQWGEGTDMQWGEGGPAWCVSRCATHMHVMT